MPDGTLAYAMEEPESLNVLGVIPELVEAGISALKIEGRQRTKSYVGAMTKVLKEALDSYYSDRAGYRVKEEWSDITLSTFEGTSETLGSYQSK
jgi:putative protease